MNPIRRPLLFSVSLFFFKKQRVCFVEKHTALDCSQSRTISRRGRNSQFCWRQIKSWISIKLLTCRLCRRLVSAGCWRINRPKTSPLPLRRYGRPRRYFPGVIPFACVCALRQSSSLRRPSCSPFTYSLIRLLYRVPFSPQIFRMHLVGRPSALEHFFHHSIDEAN